MAESVTKSEFLARVNQSRAQWDWLVGQVAPEHRQLPGVCGEWSLKAVMAHIVWYEREMVMLLHKRTFSGSPYWDLPQEERNARIHQEMAALDMNAVWSESQQTFAALAGLLLALPEESLNDPAAFPGMPADWRPWEVLASNTYEHYDDHALQLTTWLAARK